MITYNHIKFIEMSVQSVLNQKTNFDFSIVIADDCSTDGTTEFLIKLQTKYSDKIQLLLQDKNIGPAKNFDILINHPNSKYIAYMDCDDYWTDELKLQTQYDILEANDAIGLVYTHVDYLIEETNTIQHLTQRHPKTTDQIIPEMLQSKFIEFSSVMFRNSVLKNVLRILEEELKTGTIGDTRILLETAYQSQIAFIEKPMTVYRINQGSASRPTNTNRFIRVLMDSYFCRKQFVFRNMIQKKLLSHSICNTNKALIEHAFRTKTIKENYKVLRNLLILDTLKFCRMKVFVNKMNLKLFLKLFLSIFLVNVFRNKLLND